MKILVINGPNINMLGIREPNIYGTKTYANLLEYIKTAASSAGVQYETFQSNHEGAIVDAIQAAYNNYDAIVINPAAYTHTSIAILDALKAVGLPTVEVHISNISERESFRNQSFTALACQKTFSGFGFDGYKMAIDFLAKNSTANTSSDD